jgi:hypothetical protein
VSRAAAPDPSDAADAQALIREARRLRRRRRAIGLSAVILAAAATGTGYGLASGDGHSVALSGSARVTMPGQLPAATLPTGPPVTLEVAGSLAVGPSGALYVAAPGEHRILVRLPDGTFKVVAGTGTAGYSGDGGKAIDAELSDPSDLMFDANGDLHFVDSGRVRVIGTGGVIETVAGDGSTSWPPGPHPVPTVPDGTPALRASFGPGLSIAFGPGGVLYIATSTQLLRMTHGGRLDAIRTHRISFGNVAGLPASLDENLGTLALDNAGDLYVSGFNGWAIWRVAPGGAATYVGYDRGSGGSVPDLVRGPGGAVYADNGATIARVTPTSLVPVAKLASVDGQYFWAMDFTFGTHGTLYADELPGSLGFEARQELISLYQGRTTVLWTEPRPATARHSR